MHTHAKTLAASLGLKSSGERLKSHEVLAVRNAQDLCQAFHRLVAIAKKDVDTLSFCKCNCHLDVHCSEGEK